MEKNETEEFIEFRNWFFEQLDRILQTSEGAYHKSYEGQMDLIFHYPEIFNKDKEPEVELVVNCYLIGPYSRGSWHGKTIRDVINACYKDVKSWIN